MPTARHGNPCSTYIVALLDHVDRNEVLVDAWRRGIYTSKLAAATRRIVIGEKADFTRAFAAVSAVVVALGLVVVLVAVAVADAVDLG